MDNEIWKDIPDYEGLYEASSLGRIRSKEGRIRYKRDIDGNLKEIKYTNSRILKLKSGGKRRYAQICFFSEYGEQKYVYVSRVIAMTFIPNPEGKKEVNHINGDKLDNRVLNLEWVTPKENMRHSVENGLFTPTKSIILTPMNSVDTEPIVFNTMTKGNEFLGRGSSYLTERIKYHDYHVAVSMIDGSEYEIKIME